MTSMSLESQVRIYREQLPRSHIVKLKEPGPCIPVYWEEIGTAREWEGWKCSSERFWGVTAFITEVKELSSCAASVLASCAGDMPALCHPMSIWPWRAEPVSLNKRKCLTLPGRKWVQALRTRAAGHSSFVEGVLMCTCDVQLSLCPSKRQG